MYLLSLFVPNFVRLGSKICYLLPSNRQLQKIIGTLNFFTTPTTRQLRSIRSTYTWIQQELLVTRNSHLTTGDKKILQLNISRQYLTYFTILTKKSTHRSFASKVSQIKISDFSGEMFTGSGVLYSSMSATTTQLLSSGEFCKLRYDTIPVKSASANVSFYINN